jgi:hypothetical protein
MYPRCGTSQVKPVLYRLQHTYIKYRYNTISHQNVYMSMLYVYIYVKMALNDHN